ncbi:glycosyltransferase family 2 protein [Oscillatoria salina]|uniref:glycosyltransferase family 2 protein n=1 Tax=Oscillatoria salina TaxID=331517 RepID=UPI0013BBB53F|nr:glycosyltransferase family 2 protein [Oscillatoria salina]MBZ8180608.1 glycosyltransferase [Oscillatoria salina IIICB1]NET88449.1 glycosyltransferase [Kamptonema sp. SIO1D9]
MLTPLNLSVSVVIPVYNGGKSFRRCLSALKKALPLPHEVIVVADGDTDGSRQVAEEFGALVIKLPQAGGPARARNLGAKAATGDILFFIDADVEINPDAIAQVATFFEHHPNISALIGSYDDAPGASNFLSQYKNLFHHYTHQTAKENASTFWGACGAIRRNVFLSLGGFDENYRLPCVEDIELGYRLKAAGYKIRLCKDIQVKHLKHWSPISLLKAEFFYRALPWTALILRSHSLNNDLNLQTSHRLSAVLTYIFICALISAWWLPGLAAIAATIAIVLFTLNLEVYHFFLKKRGLLFAAQTIPWHWFYYFYSALAFAIGFIRHSYNELKTKRIFFFSFLRQNHTQYLSR